MICVLLGLLYAADQNRVDPAALAAYVRQEFREHANLLHTAKGRHIVAVLGNTGSGKSTIVNRIADKALKVVYGNDYVLVDENDATAMPIGLRGSMTVYPKAIPVGDLLVVDLPGLHDTKGTKRNLVNAAFIKQILTEAASVRLFFVVGQDEFTAKRGGPVKEMFDGIQRVFVSTDPTVNLIEQNSALVLTKSTCVEPADAMEFLLGRTDDEYRDALQKQLAIWFEHSKFCQMHHPTQAGANSAFEREEMLKLVQETNPGRVEGININAIYPAAMMDQLTEMFYHVMNQSLQERLDQAPKTLTDFDAAIGYYSHPEFWKTFDGEVSGLEAIDLLKNFCHGNYEIALTRFRDDHAARIPQAVQELNARKNEVIRMIQLACKERLDREIEKYREARRAAVDPLQFPQDQVGAAGLPLLQGLSPTFHNDLYELICSEQNIGIPVEKERERDIFRRYWAYCMDQYCQQQIAKFCREVGEENNKRVAEQIAQHRQELALQADKHRQVQAEQIENIRKELLASLETERAHNTQTSAALSTQLSTSFQKHDVQLASHLHSIAILQTRMGANAEVFNNHVHLREHGTLPVMGLPAQAVGTSARMK